MCFFLVFTPFKLNARCHSVVFQPLSGCNCRDFRVQSRHVHILYWLWSTRHIYGNNPPLWAYYLLRLTNLDFTHQDLPHPSVSMHFFQPSRGHVNATLHQACQLVDYTPDSSTRLLHYLHIKPQISRTDQQWSSGCPYSFFKHGKEERVF